MCIFPIMYSEINILMLNVNFVQDSRCILHNGKYDFAGDRAWNCFEYSFRGYETFENRDGSIFPIS